MHIVSVLSSELLRYLSLTFLLPLHYNGCEWNLIQHRKMIFDKLNSSMSQRTMSWLVQIKCFCWVHHHSPVRSTLQHIYCMTLCLRTSQGCGDPQFLKNLFYLLVSFIAPLTFGIIFFCNLAPPSAWKCNSLIHHCHKYGNVQTIAS